MPRSQSPLLVRKRRSGDEKATKRRAKLSHNIALRVGKALMMPAFMSNPVNMTNDCVLLPMMIYIYIYTKNLYYSKCLEYTKRSEHSERPLRTAYQQLPKFWTINGGLNPTFETPQEILGAHNSSLISRSFSRVLRESNPQNMASRRMAKPTKSLSSGAPDTPLHHYTRRNSGRADQ